ncbi:ShlB/FhaC/HecB family hemolysin secretion/activation protein [Erwinia amylovora]|uniref:ShlB/FhaC/HecB family hemolysin secretion/activation protein n=1 Tax=Erwinia amylovora TaxID=552 RepID=UPI001443BE48|nr:ShlB/FhaC/HecB family hemolysin secretion/activation protein [Erwinia amylovora]
METITLKIKLSVVVFITVVSGQSSGEMLPALVDPNNPTRQSRDVSGPEPVNQLTTPGALPELAAPSPAMTLQTLVTFERIHFVGGTRYPLVTLMQPFNALVGKKVSLQTLVAAVDSITQRYHREGYPLSYAYIPADNFHQGVLNIGLVEGYVANSQIRSDNQQTGRWLGALSQRIMAEKPLTQDTFDRYSMLMSRTPDTKVKATAQAPNNIYGATNLEVDAQRSHNWNVINTLDIRKKQSLDLVSATLSGLTPYAEQLGVATIIPLNNQTRESYLGLNYQQYLGDDGLQLQVKGSYLNQNPKDFTTILTQANGVNINAREKEVLYNAGVGLNYPLLLTAKQQWSLGGELDYVHKRYDYTLQAEQGGITADLPAINQQIRYPAVELNLSGSHQYQQASWNTRFSVRQGIDGLGASNTTGPGDLSFTRWRFNGDAAWVFNQKWRLSSAVEGDWSDSSLPEPERLTFGAFRFGSGYPDSDATGDYGMGGQVEMRYLHDRSTGDWVKTIQPYVKVDAAHTAFHQSGLSSQKLASYGAGVMFGDNRHYALTLEAARPIADVPIDSSRRDWRFSATFTYNFNNGS